jgi:hypothetical protein
MTAIFGWFEPWGPTGPLSLSEGSVTRRACVFVVAEVGRALRRSARRVARMYGTPIYIWKDGKVVAEKP